MFRITEIIMRFSKNRFHSLRAVALLAESFFWYSWLALMSTFDSNINLFPLNGKTKTNNRLEMEFLKIVRHVTILLMLVVNYFFMELINFFCMDSVCIYWAKDNLVINTGFVYFPVILMRPMLRPPSFSSPSRSIHPLADTWLYECLFCTYVLVFWHLTETFMFLVSCFAALIDASCYYLMWWFWSICVMFVMVSYPYPIVSIFSIDSINSNLLKYSNIVMRERTWSVFIFIARISTIKTFFFQQQQPLSDIPLKKM